MSGAEPPPWCTVQLRPLGIKTGQRHRPSTLILAPVLRRAGPFLFGAMQARGGMAHVDYFPKAVVLEPRDRTRMGRGQEARAFPPFFPNSTAAGSLPCSSGVGSRSGVSPVAISMIRLASWLGSRGAFGGHIGRLSR
jgi:hypothetical protein